MVMPPNNFPPAPPPITPGSNPYDFITNPGQTPKKSFLSMPGGNSTKTRILIVAGGALVLIILAAIIMTVLGSAGKQNANDLVLAAQQQEELRRISEIAAQDARSTAAKNLATTALYTLQSDQKALHNIVGKVKKVDKKLLASGKDEKTTTLLTEAKQANRFDEVFLELFKTELQEYQRTLKRVHDGSSSKTNKAILAGQFRNVGLLIGESTD